jgi:hypothetical protein
LNPLLFFWQQTGLNVHLVQSFSYSLLQNLVESHFGPSSSLLSDRTFGLDDGSPSLILGRGLKESIEDIVFEFLDGWALVADSNLEEMGEISDDRDLLGKSALVLQPKEGLEDRLDM